MNQQVYPEIQTPGSASHPYARDSNTDKFGSPQEEYSGEDSGQDGQDGSRKRPRQRPMSVSCELCKIRKVKCDRGQPNCGWCNRNGQVCEYKERKKPGLRAGYGRELEQRMDTLENIVQSQGRLIEALRTNGTPSMPLPSSQDGQIYGATPSQPHSMRPEPSHFHQRSSTYPDPQQLASSGMMAYTESLETHGPQMQQGENYSQQIQASNGQQQTVQDVPQGNTHHTYYSNSNPPLESPTLNILNGSQSALRPQEHNFPPYDLLYALTDLYFKHINTWCPILHRRTTLDTLFGPSTLDEADRILLHAIVATTLRFSNDSRLSEQNRQMYHDSSKEKVLLYGLENSSVKALQALVILALDLVGSSNGPPGWNLLALMTRSVVQLGLAVETTSPSLTPDHPSIYTLRAMVLPEAKDWVEDESRRRLFWMIYILDRYATVVTAFEFALDEKEIDRKLPCRDDFFVRNQPAETKWFQTSDRLDYGTNRSEALGSFSYHIEILGILSKIHLFLKKRVDISTLSDVEEWQRTYRVLDNMVRTWQLGLPGEYGNFPRVFNSNGGNRSINCGWIMLHATYHFTLIRLHSSAAYPAHRSPIFTPSYSAAQRCHAAVENIIALGQYVVNNGMLNQLGPPFAFSLWVAARVLLVHGSTIENYINPEIQFLIDTLREMGKFWQVADRYCAILQRVVDEWRESERSLNASGQRVTPSSVKILADMRRCAYDLDVLISRQPRHQASRKISVIPARTPAPNELDYLEAFDFFNVPRLPVSANVPLSGTIDPSLQGPDGSNASNQFNMTNFSVDASSDWLFKHNA